MTSIAGKTILLTGASRGIGAFIARTLAKEKTTIVGISRSKEGLNKIGAEVKAVGGEWIAVNFDISQIEELPILLEQINQRVGTIDILINNAGIEIYRAFQDYSTVEIQSILTTNLLAAMELSRLVLPTLLHKGSGHLVNIASLAGKKSPAYNSIYAASKAGLIGWSDALRQELAGTGVQISVICPGYVSQEGMSADTGVPVPKLSGISTPEKVALATIKAIKYNQAEVIVNQYFFTEWLTRLLLTICQFFPRLGDTVYRWIGVTTLNKMRVKHKTQATNIIGNPSSESNPSQYSTRN
jgi:short-subunit dehydrogenase